MDNHRLIMPLTWQCMRRIPVFREILSPNHKFSLPPSLSVLHAVGLSFGLIILTNAFYTGFGIRWPGYIAYALIGVLAVLLFRRAVSQYILAIEDGLIIFLSGTGVREKRLVAMPADTVTSLELMGDTLPQRPFEQFCKLDGPQKPWLLVGKTESGTDCRVVFCPSEKAIQALKESTGA